MKYSVLFLSFSFFNFSENSFGSKKNFYLLSGDCKLPFDPKQEGETLEAKNFLCLQGSVDNDLAYVPKKKLVLLHQSQFHGSWHYGERQSIHYEYNFEQMASRSSEFPFTRSHELKLLAYHFGSNTDDKLRFTIGQQYLPFGINQFPSGSLKQIFEPRYFWGPVHRGLTLIFDNLQQTTLEVGAGYDKMERTQDKDPFSISARLMYDFSILNGTRIVLSFFGRRTDERRYSIGILNVSSSRSLFHAEGVRIYSDARSKEKPFQQLIRLSYEDALGKKTRTFVLYDDVKWTYRLFTLGTSVSFLRYLHTRFGAAYKKDESGAKAHRWYFFTGFGLHL